MPLAKTGEEGNKTERRRWAYEDWVLDSGGEPAREVLASYLAIKKKLLAEHPEGMPRLPAELLYKPEYKP